MNRLKYLSLATTVLLGGLSFNAYSQNAYDALRYSYLMPQGTARSMGFGNALGSVGGDFSSLSINPAGIGIYRGSEFTITPSLKINSVNGQYLNNSMSSNNTRFNFNNIGLVFTHAKKGRRYEKSKWKDVSFGIGINRLADFNSDYAYSGNNYSTSATQSYAADATLNGNQNGLGYASYQSYLIDTSGNKFVSALDPSKGLKQLRTLSERGGINELDMTLGGNYMERLMLGATLGIPILDYQSTGTYSETSLTPGTDFNTYTMNENLTTSGAGINLKLGAIYKFSEYFRIGAAVHSPTYYSLHDNYNADIYSSFTSVGNGDVALGSNNYDYGLTTPWRGILSATGFLGKFGFISADYEYVAYNTAHFYYSDDAVDENAVNQQIKSALQPASNFRIGAEGRITNFFMVRLGFDYYGNPYKNTDGVNCNSIAFSGGVGFRFSHWFIDAALVHTQYNGLEQPYDAPSVGMMVPTATLQNSLNNAALTLGFRF